MRTYTLRFILDGFPQKFVVDGPSMIRLVAELDRNSKVFTVIKNYKGGLK